MRRHQAFSILFSVAWLSQSTGGFAALSREDLNWVPSQTESTALHQPSGSASSAVFSRIVELSAMPKVRYREMSVDLTKGKAVNLLQALGSVKMKDRASRATLESEFFEAPMQFVSLGARWRTTSPSGLMIKVRGSLDGVTWTDWHTLSDNETPDEGNDPSTMSSSLIYLGPSIRFIQYTLTFSASNSEANELSNLILVFINPGETPKWKLNDLEIKREISASAGKPPIVSRTSWGCPDGESSPQFPPTYTTVTHLIIHHTATRNSATDWPAEVRSIWTYHTYSNKWGDIGYNYLIDPNGIVYEGRAGGDNVVGAHFSCQNDNTMGVALLGTYSSSLPTTNALNSLDNLLAWKCAEESLDPLGSSFHPGTALTLHTISGHRDANPSLKICKVNGRLKTTTCPGNTLYNNLSEIRAEVDQRIAPGAVSVTLSANPTSSVAPLDGVTLSAMVGGSAQGTINYTFYCNRADAGTNITPNPSAKFDGVRNNPMTVAGLCNYPSPGTYTANVIAERGSGAAESRVPITVSSVGSTCRLLILASNNTSGGGIPTASPANSASCSSGQYTAGQRITVTASPSAGWSVGSWVGTQNDASMSATNSVLMPDARLRVTVNYIQPPAIGAPALSGEGADGITPNSATLHASVNPNGLSTNVSFKYGIGVPASFLSTPSQNIGSVQQVLPFSANLASLSCGATYTYYASATNSAGTATGLSQIFSTSPCGATLTILTTSVPDAAPNQPYSVQLTASGGTGSGYVWSLQAGTLPFGLTLNAQTGVISGTPTQGGTSSGFTVGVRDSGGNSTNRRYSLYVQQTPGPTITSSAPSSFVFSVGAPYTRPNSITYLAEGGQAPYSWQATGLPPGLQIDPAGGFLFGTPSQAGSFQAEIMVSDSLEESASLAAMLRVVVNALIITDSSGHTPPNPPAGTLGTSYQFYFAAQGGSLSGYTWSISQGTLPPGLGAQKPAGCTSSTCAFVISGTPTQGGTFSFTVTVSDSLGDTTSQVATIIINTGIPPSIQTVRLPIATIGSAYSTPLAASSGTPNYRWSFVGASPDPGIQLSPSGVLSGTPTLTNDCPTGATDGPAIWVGPNYPTRYFSVQVTDAAGQSATTNLCLVSYHPLPQLTDAEPPSVIVDGQNHTITVHGTNLRNDSMLEVGSNSPSPTTYVSPTTVTFNLYPAPGGAFSTSPGGGVYGETTYALKIVQPYASFATSSINFAIFDPPPTVSSVTAVLTNSSQPCRTNVSCELVVTGTGLVYSTSYLVVESSQSLSRDVYPSTAIPWTQVTAGIFSVSTAGTYTLRVTNISQPSGQPAIVNIPFTVQP